MVSRLIYVQFRQRFLSLELREGRKFVATGLAGVDPAQPQWFSPMQAVLSEPAPGLHLLVRSAVAFLLVASCICLGELQGALVGEFVRIPNQFPGSAKIGLCCLIE